MKKSIQWRVGLIALSVLVALFLFLPSTPLSTRLPEWWHQSVPKISLGLDLRGGSHIVMQVETDKAVVEIPSPHAGRIARLLAPLRARVPIGAPLVAFAEGAEPDTGTAVGVVEPAGGARK